MHKIPLTPTEEAGIIAHGLQRNIGKPSQITDAFRQGVAWGIAAEREACAKLADSMNTFGLPPDVGAAIRKRSSEKVDGEL